jgi:superfamily II DNA helicase RecQ
LGKQHTCEQLVSLSASGKAQKGRKFFVILLMSRIFLAWLNNFSHGHIPPLARLIKTPSFTKSIGLLLIDEGHHIVTNGQPHRNGPPHQPVYGKLGDVLVQLPDAVPCGVFLVTLPPPVKEFICSDLQMKEIKMLEINLCTNRPNILQAVIPMISHIGNISNLDLLVPVPYHPSMSLLQRGIVFIDHKLSTAKAAEYLNSHCPPGLQETAPFRHLHSGMSQDYINMTYGAFKQLNSHIRILVMITAGSHASQWMFLLND